MSFWGGSPIIEIDGQERGAFMHSEFQVKKQLILSVEDEPGQQAIIRSMLEADYTLLFAKTGEEAVSLFESHHHDISLILLDIQLPDMTGHELYKRFEAIAFMAIPSIVMVTAFNSPSEIVKSMTETGAFYHLPKPFSKPFLMDIIKKAIESPLFVRRTDELGRDLLIDSILDFRNYKIVTELLSIKKDMGQFLSQSELESYVFFNKSSARKNMDLRDAVSLFEGDTGEEAPAAWVPRVLIVEDEKAIRDLYEGTLEDTMYQFTLVADAFSAINYIRKEEPFDLVVLDIGLPGLNGVEVIHEIKETVGKVAPDIIVVSSYVDQDTITNVVKAGASSYLNKPLSKQDLLNVLNRTFFKRYALRVLPMMKDLLQSQPMSFRNRFYQLNENLKKLSISHVPMSKIYVYFPEFICSEYTSDSEVPIKTDEALKAFLMLLKDKSNHRVLPKKVSFLLKDD